MRTIRIKLYRFSELSKEAQQLAIINEGKRFRRSFNLRDDKELTESEFNSAKERLIKYDYEFTKDGKLTNTN